MSQRLVNQAADPFRLERLPQDVGRMDKTRGEVERDVVGRWTRRIKGAQAEEEHRWGTDRVVPKPHCVRADAFRRNILSKGWSVQYKCAWKRA